MTTAGAVGAEAQYPVWDRVVRTIHWYFPLAIGTMWWSGEQGRMDIHEWVGYSMIVAVLTRIVWGFIGSEAARFGHFLTGPPGVWRYLRQGGKHRGHTPLGALSVIALLILLLAQAVSGTMSSDDLLFEGPFSYWAGDWAGAITEWHETNWRLLQVFIALHILAIGWYQFRKKEPLIQAMWRGRSGTKFSQTPPSPQWQAVLTAVAVVGLLGTLVAVAPEAPSYY